MSSPNVAAMERFALATAAQRARILTETHAANSDEGMRAALQQAQIVLMEARAAESTASGAPAVASAYLLALMQTETQLAHVLRDSPFAHSQEAQSQDTRTQAAGSTANELLLRHDLLSLDVRGVNGPASGAENDVANGEKRSEILDRLRQRLGVQLDQYVQRLPAHESQQQAAAKPSVLDSSELQLPRLLSSALASSGLSGLTPLAWEWASRQQLTPAQVTQFLQSQLQPLLRNIVELVVQHLDTPLPQSAATKEPVYPQFGSLPIHRALTLDQLRELGAQKPDLLASNQLFVEQLLLQGQPASACTTQAFELPESEGGPLSDQAKREYLSSLWTFASELAPVHTALKGIVWFHVLWYSMRLFDEINFAHLKSYIELPRASAYSTFLRPRTDAELGLTGLSPDQARVRRTQLFDVQSQLLRQQESIFTQLRPENEAALIEFALRKQQSEAVSDPTLSNDPAFSSSTSWMDYLNQAWLAKTIAKNILTSAELSSRLSPAQLDQQRTVLGSAELQALREQVRVEFGSLLPGVRNPAVLRSSPSAAPVKLHVLLKACPTLIVKTFVIHTCNFFTKKQTEIDASIELDGLTPREERVLHFADDANYSDFHVREVELDLECINKERRGVFIVELMGGGFRARCILRKGAIAAISNWSAQGHVFRLIDVESAQALINPSVYLNGQTYHGDPATGLVLVPFSTQPNPNQVIVLRGSLPSSSAAGQDENDDNGTFATLSSFSYMQELCSLSANFFVDREALLAKTRAPLLVKANLSLHGQSVNAAAHLYKATLKVDMTDDEGTPSTQLVDPFPLHADAESVHSLSVPARLLSVTFTLSGEVRLKSNGETKTLSSTKTIMINAAEQTNFMEDFYLKFGSGGKLVRAGEESKEDDAAGCSSGEYALYVLGKSGEPIRGRQVRVTLYHQFLTAPVRHGPWLELASDENGCIALGKLENCYKIVVTPLGTDSHTTPQTHEWALAAAPQIVRSMQQQMLVAQEGSTVTIPLSADVRTVDASTFVLAVQRGSDRGVHSALGQLLPVEKHVSLVHSATQHELRVSSLPPGRYLLTAKSPLWFDAGRFHQWLLYVVAGPTLMQAEYVLDRRSQQFLQADRPAVQQAGKLHIVSARVEGQELRIQLVGANASTRVHVVSSHFAPDFDLYGHFATQALARPRVQQYRALRNAYLGQKVLGDEVRYVLERKLAGERVGVMLPRPSLLLHEKVRQSTHFAADPTLSTGEAYSKDDSFGSFESECATMACAPASAKVARSQLLTRSARVGAMERAADAVDAEAAASVGLTAYDGGTPLSRHQFEFLVAPSTTLANLRPDAETGVLLIPLSAFRETHTAVSILALDNNDQIASSRVPLKEAATVKYVPTSSGENALQLAAGFRDMRLYPALDCSKHFCEAHLVTCLPHAGDTLVVSDAQSSEVASFDSLADVWTLFRTLCTQRGESAITEAMSKFDCVLQWPQLSPEEQDAKYSELACHELHLFLYHRDAAFFRRVVAPFLRNKFQKTFVDLFLLGHDLTPYLQPHAFHVLNTFERILLARWCHENGKTAAQQQQAVAILDLIIQTAAATLPDDASTQLALFKTAMSIKSAAKQAEAEAEAEQGQDQKPRDRARESKEKRKKSKPMAAMDEEEEEADEDADKADMDARRAPMRPARAMMKMKKSARRSEADGDDASFDDASAMMDESGTAARKLYTDPPSTKEYEERNYFLVSNARVEDATELIAMHRFWAAYASHLKQSWAPNQGGAGLASVSQPFLTRHLDLSEGATLTDVLLRATVLDLPLPGQQRPHTQSDARERSLRLQAGSAAIVFHREMREVAPARSSASADAPVAMSDDDGAAGASSSSRPPAAVPAAPSAISLSSSYFDPLDLFESDSSADDDGSEGERVDKCITGPFLSAHLYGCRVVATNTASSRARLALLLQAPEGSVTVGSFGQRGLATHTRTVDLAPYASEVVSFLFYFPVAGTFAHYPPAAAKRGVSAGRGEPRTLTVVARPSSSEPNRRDWKSISQSGSNAEVLAFLARENLLKVDLSLLAWRCHTAARTVSVAGDPRAFFSSVVSLLRSRLVFDTRVWSFVFLHPDARTLGELLQRSPQVTSKVGRFLFAGQLLQKDAVEAEWGEYQHLEYSPLLNARAHTLRTRGAAGAAQAPLIQNVELAAQYERLLAYLSERVSGSERMGATHKLSLVYYLLLQDRVEEARRCFDELEAAERSADSSASSVAAASASPVCAVQRDYLRCYFAFNSADPSAALGIARRYTSHPVARQRKLFTEVETQLMEMSAQVDPAELLDEHSKDPSQPRDAQDHERELGNLAASEPTLDLSFASPTMLEVRSENVTSAQLNFFSMNIELMFSAAPFLLSESSGNSGAAGGPTSSFLCVTPNLTLQLSLPASRAGGHQRAPLQVPIPAQFQQSNCWIELTNAAPASSVASPSASASVPGIAPAAGAGSVSVVRAHFAHQLYVQLTASYGQLRVTHAQTGQPLPMTYVKVYAQTKDGGQTSFYKDGYTDLRGKFDYVSLSTDRLGSVSRFALLILHKQYGAQVKVAQPPQR